MIIIVFIQINIIKSNIIIYNIIINIKINVIIIII